MLFVCTKEIANENITTLFSGPVASFGFTKEVADKEIFVCAKDILKILKNVRRKLIIEGQTNTKKNHEKLTVRVGMGVRRPTCFWVGEPG